MKLAYKLSFVLSLAFAFSSCDFDTELTQNTETASAYTSVQDVENGTIGAYQALGSYRLYGNYAVAFGDFSGGLADGSASTGHFYYISNWAITENTSELESLWQYGFKVVDRTVRTINGADNLLKTNSKLTDDEKATLYYDKSQCFGLRALAYFTLANMFCYPYNKGTEAKGLPIIKDQPVDAFQNATRATLGETYDFICADIDSALVNSEKADVSTLQYFYMNKAAIYALKARVSLYMGKYDEAEAAAKQAIELKGKGDGTYTDCDPTNETYLNMWASVNVTDEDIFTICKTENDNLSANSLNTLYGSYLGTVSDYCLGFFTDQNTDIRRNLVGTVDSNKNYGCKKYQGIETSQATSNIPVFRKSEMSLIIAECEARKGNLETAKEYLGYTAKRDTQYATSAGVCDLSLLPDTQEGLLDFIWEENTREFFGEGHFYFDARRLDRTITVMGGKCTTFKPANFVFPIPAAEINAGFMKEQNTNWSDNLPVQDKE